MAVCHLYPDTAPGGLQLGAGAEAALGGQMSRDRKLDRKVEGKHRKDDRKMERKIQER